MTDGRKRVAARRPLLTYRNMAKTLMACGLTGCAGAVAWWYVFFEHMLGTDVKAASECFYWTTVECQVGNFVGSFFETPPYEPALLWASGLVIGIGFLVYVFTDR